MEVLEGKKPASILNPTEKREALYKVFLGEGKAEKKIGTRKKEVCQEGKEEHK